MRKTVQDLKTSFTMPIQPISDTQNRLSQGFSMVESGHDALKGCHYTQAISCYEQAVKLFRGILSDRPHDSVARDGLQLVWSSIANVYPTLDVINSAPDVQMFLDDSVASTRFMQKLKTVFVDNLVENSWRKQCEGKYGGPKASHITWKQFYEENEAVLERLSKKQRFNWAVKHGHLQLVKEVIRQADVNERVGDEDPLLFSAIQNGFTSVAKLLVAEGASVSVKGAGQWSALHWAVYKSNLEIVTLLLSKKSAVNVKDVKGLMPMHFAAFKGSIPIAKLLIAKKAKVNIVAEDGTSPIHWAVFSGYPDMVALLIEHGAKVDMQDMFGRTLLHWSTARGRRDIVRLLLKAGAKVDLKDQFGRSALHWAAEKGDYDSVVSLLDHGAKVNEVDNYGDRPMILAALHQHNKIVSLLFERGSR